MKDSWDYKHVMYSPYLLTEIFADKILIKEYEEPAEDKPFPDISFLPIPQRQVIELYLMHKNFTEMGFILNISKQAAQRRFTRAIKTLQKRYK